jgi:hypothetical protein
VATLVRDGLELNYEVRGGSGPGLLLPYVNFSWPEQNEACAGCGSRDPRSDSCRMRERKRDYDRHDG